jgi:adenylate cyclase
MERRLAAIFALDMVGYSRLMESDEADTLSRHKSLRQELIDPAISAHNGRVVKSTGDGLLVEFSSAVDAVECAVEIQRDMTSRTPDVPVERRIQFRIGINVGDVVVEDGDIHGDGVNVAARIESLADPGGIFISGSAHHQVRNKVKLGFEDLGLHEVKNLALPVHVFRVLLDPAATGTSPGRRSFKQRQVVQWAVAYFAVAWLSLELFDLVAEQFMWPIWIRQGATVLLLFGLLITLVLAWQHGERGRQKVGAGEFVLLVALLTLAGGSVWMLKSRSQALPLGQSSVAGFAFRQAPLPEHSVAVLPCTNLSGDAEHEHFADGLAAELITRLSAVSELRVPSQTSSFTFKGRNVPIEEVASTLRVRNVLECGVTVEGTRLRVSTRLVNAETGYTLWSQAYDRGVEGLLDVQKEIATTVVARLEVELRSNETRQLTRRWTEDPEAYDHFLRGIQYQLRAPTPDNVELGRQQFEKAIELDPEFGRAYARLAVQWVVIANYLYAPAVEAYTEVERLAERAIELDGELFEAYWALGWSELSFRYAWQRAIEHFQRTIALAPGEWAGYHSLGMVKGVLGQTDEQLEAAQIAFDLDPLAYWPQIGLLSAAARRRDYDEGVRQSAKLAEMQPDDPFSRIELAVMLVRAGRIPEAQVYRTEAEQLAPGAPGIHLWAAMVDAAAGDSIRALAAVETFLATGRTPETPGIEGILASLYGELGLRDEAMRWLTQAHRNHDTTMLFLDNEAFDSLREDDRFATLIRELELPEDIYLRPRI